MHKSGILLFVIISLSLSVINRDINVKLDKQIEIDIHDLIVKADEKILNNNFDTAIEIINKAVSITSFINNSVKGILYLKLGACYFQSNKYNLSIINTRRGIYLLENSSKYLNNEDERQKLYGYIQLSNTLRILNYPDSALYYLNLAKQEIKHDSLNSRSENNDKIIAEILSWESLIHFEIGNLDSSLFLCFNSLAIRNSYNSKCIIANNYSQLGDIFTRNEEFDKAELYYTKSVRIIKNCYGDSSIYYSEKITSLGYLYYESGQYSKALSCFNLSLNIFKTLFPPGDVQLAYCYNNLADTYCRLSNYSFGIRLYNLALEIFLKNNLFDELSVIYHNLGNASLERGDYSSSEIYYNKALESANKFRKSKNIYTSYTYKRLGNLFFLKNDYKESIKYYNKAIAELGAISNDSNLKESAFLQGPTLSMIDLFESYYQKGKCELYEFRNNHDKQYLDYSISSFRTASLISDILRNQYTDEKMKRRINQICVPLFNNYLKAACILKEKYHQNRDDLILEIIERNKYTALRSMLITSKWNYNENIPISTGIVLDSLYKRNRYLKSNAALNIDDDEIFKLNYSIDSINNYLMANFPNYKKSIYTDIYYTIQDVQSKLDDSTGVVNYQISDSLLITLAINNINYKINISKIDNSFFKHIKEFDHAIKFSDSEIIIKEGIHLFDLLIKPIQDIINPRNTLVIVPDHSFFKIPFELLIDSNNTCEEPILSEQNFLLNKFNLSYQYSLNLWCDKLKINQSHNNSNWEFSFIGFAPFASENNTNSINCDKNLLLSHSKNEVENICSLYQTLHYKSISYIGYEANEIEIIKSLKESKIVHIASHSFLSENHNNSHIRLRTKKIINSQKISDNISYPENIFSILDGRLYLSEIYNLDIHSDLVTLSICQSGAGNTYEGEGIISIAQGFYYSGANNIVFTLWNVSDKHTNEFMEKYYKYLNLGYSYVSALRKVKLDFIQSNYVLPKFWSGFQIIC